VNDGRRAADEGTAACRKSISREEIWRTNLERDGASLLPEEESEVLSEKGKSMANGAEEKLASVISSISIRPRGTGGIKYRSKA
jgi:hypothetical protein